ncbi:MAG: TetR family transcriptional regulator [Actinomycetia bacterium]|nr:TetR family transcriptional regulator [Actinomycetes bacterium]
MPEPEARRATARDRLLAAAEDLFYAEGVQSVGIDRVIEHAGVAKASLYRAFRSKEELVAAYLEARHRTILAELNEAVAGEHEPRARLLAVFDSLARRSRRPSSNGCAFARASAEPSAGAKVLEETASYRHDVRSLLTDLSAEAGAPDAAQLGTQLFLLYHGGSVIVTSSQQADLLPALRSAAEALIDAALAASPRPS